MSRTAQPPQRLGHSFSTWLDQWSLRRHGVDVSPLQITQRRIYILPTGLGLTYAVAVIAMGIGGMNYGNNLALMLAFLLAALGFVAMHHCHRNLLGLSIHSMANEPAFAGESATFQLSLDNHSPQPRFALRMETGAHHTQMMLVAEQAQSVLRIALPTTRRGWLKLERVNLSTRYPFGLFRAWSVLHLPLQCLVYPKPSDSRTTPPPAAFDTRNTQDLQRGDDEFAGLRPFHPGDSPNRIAWKAYAREQGLLVKQYAGASISTRVLDWDALAGLDVETRLTRLCRWVIDSHQQGIAYGLKLPGFSAAPALNEAHRARCLSALALFNT